MQRHFNPKQKEALRLMSGGKCESCGGDLGDDWHADHKKPWSKGGETDMGNAQALCSKCNLKKGAKEAMQLRGWQVEFCKKIKTWDKPDFLLTACPAAGKTTAALSHIKQEFEDGNFNYLIVVVYTEHLKRQWTVAAETFNLSIQSDWNNNLLSQYGMGHKDFIGFAATYAQVASNPYVFQKLSYDKNLFVVFDEIHHCGEDNSLKWGEAIKTAFAEAKFRLSLSGTPFRHDGNPIPFIHYNDYGKSESDFPYSYLQGMLDAHCRRIYFNAWDGPAQWKSDGIEHKYEISENIPKNLESKRLNTILNSSGEFIEKFFTAADRELKQKREEEDHNAAGMIVCKDQRHAQLCARKIESISHTVPTLVISDDPTSSQKIQEFRHNSNLWLVSVQMVSEGVDIPRLRVGVFATNVLTDLYFRQFCGRFIRGSNTAHIFIPNEPRIRQLASKIEEEVSIALKDLREKDGIILTDDERKEYFSDYEFMSSNGEEKLILIGGKEYETQEAKLIAMFREDFSELNGLREERIKKFFVKYENLKAAKNPNVALTKEKYLTTEERLVHERKKLNKRVQKLFYEMEKIDGEVQFSNVWNKVKSLANISLAKELKACTFEEIETANKAIDYIRKNL